MQSAPQRLLFPSSLPCAEGVCTLLSCSWPQPGSYRAGRPAALRRAALQAAGGQGGDAEGGDARAVRLHLKQMLDEVRLLILFLTVCFYYV